MKYIFDFDDVLFFNTFKFKKHMYECLEKAGISHKIASKYYNEVREKGFSIKNFVTTLLKNEKVNEINGEKLCEAIMCKSKNFVNEDLLKIIKRVGKENCYIVTHGEKEYQLEKINRTGIASLFCEIIVVQDSKKKSVEKICAKYKNEKIIFIDDKAKHFENLDFKKYPNLKTILYAGQNSKDLFK